MRNGVVEFFFKNWSVVAVDGIDQEEWIDDTIKELRSIIKLTGPAGRKLNYDELEGIVAKCVDKGLIDLAEWTVDLLGRNLGRDELECILSKCVLEGWLDSAEWVVDLLGRDLNKRELKHILAVYDRKGLVVYSDMIKARIASI